MKIMLIRHGKTEGNNRKKYIGSTDEALSLTGKEELIHFKEKGYYPEGAGLFSSPMKRCRQSAELIYPGQDYELVKEISECSFGEFEGKGYHELKNRTEYQLWISGIGDPPGGEGHQQFKGRVWKGFEGILRIASEKKMETVAVVLHGGSIMGIMGVLLGAPERFYDFQVKNGRGFCLEFAQRDEKEEWKLLSYREL